MVHYNKFYFIFQYRKKFFNQGIFANSCEYNSFDVEQFVKSQQIAKDSLTQRGFCGKL